jgi:hypothetical protein
MVGLVTPDLRQMRYVVEVAKERGFSRAAVNLHVAQEAVSQQIKVVEPALGVQLFERTNRGVELTAAGEAFVQEARRASAPPTASASWHRPRRGRSPMKKPQVYDLGLRGIPTRMRTGVFALRERSSPSSPCVTRDSRNGEPRHPLHVPRATRPTPHQRTDVSRPMIAAHRRAAPRVPERRVMSRFLGVAAGRDPIWRTRSMSTRRFPRPSNG